MDQTEPDKKEAVEEGEIKELLEENLELNKENHELLKGIEKRARWSLIFSSIKWIVIIGSAFGLYYYFDQLFGGTINIYRDLLGTNVASSTSSGILKIEDKVKAIIREI